MQRQEELWFQGVNVVVLQRRVFVCALKLAMDESLSHQHMGVVHHQGRSPSASTSESHGGGRDHVNDQAGSSTSVNNATTKRAVDSRDECHSTAEAGLPCGRKRRGSDDESSGAQLPKSKASVRKEVDSEERHSAAEANLPIAKERMKMQGNG
ncbi:hypothetical protein GW17_00009945 [Ensete ventricosum]|nr:hypothetical protein GW17_00009945 [Ensete ventricosum]